jgi:hypothetical protein
MQEFIILFELFGKTFRVKVKDISRFAAQEQVKQKVLENIVFKKDIPKKEQQVKRDDDVDFLKSLFGFK